MCFCPFADRFSSRQERRFTIRKLIRGETGPEEHMPMIQISLCELLPTLTADLFQIEMQSVEALNSRFTELSKPLFDRIDETN